MEIKFEDIQKANETIKTTDIKGKEYAEVNQRIKAFRMVYPTGLINTKMLKDENGICVFRAEVGYLEKDETGKATIFVLGSGTAYEKENSSFINKTSYIENCETSAVGRALGMAGFGIDTSIRSAEEMLNAELQQDAIKPITKTMEAALRDFITNNNIQDEKVIEVLSKFNYTKLNQIKIKDYKTIQEKLGGKE